MKTFKQFIEEATASERVLARALELAKVNKNNPEKLKVYVNLLKNARKRATGSEYEREYDYPERESARRDKYLIPSHRTSSFPELSGVSTVSRNPKKIRKQKAIGEISK